MKPYKLILQNFFSHRSSEIDFSGFNSALLIGNVDGNFDISNGSGKSAIFEGVLWALFNKARVSAMDDIILWGEDECNVIFEFSHEETLYKIERMRNRVTSTSTVSFFEQNEVGEWTDISGSTPSLTNNVIVQKIKFDYNTFINSAYFRQNDISEFTESDAGKRQKILKSIVDISRWDIYQEQAKETLKELKTEIKLLEKMMDDVLAYQKELLVVQDRIVEVEKDIAQNNSAKDYLSAHLESLTGQYSTIKSSLDTNAWDSTLSKLKDLENKKPSLQKNYERKKADVEKLISSEEKLTNEIALIKTEIESIFFMANAEELLEAATTTASDLKAQIAICESKIKEQQEIIFKEGECHSCSQPLSEELYNSLQVKNDKIISDAKRDLIFNKNKLLQIQSLIKDYKDSILKSKRKAELMLLLAAKESAILQLLQDIDIRKADSDVAANELKANEDSIISGKKLLEAIRNDDFKALRKEIEEDTKKIKLTEEDLRVLSMEFGVLLEKKKNLESNIEKNSTRKLDLAEKITKADVYTKIVKLLGKSGIQTILLNSVIQDLETTTNSILKTICNESFEVLIDVQRIHSDGVSIVDTLDLRVKKSEIVQHFKSLSGGEKFRVSLAIRVALSEISSRHGGSHLEFLLLDEVNSPLDKFGTETLFVNVIRSLEKNFKILVITHDDALKEHFMDIIQVSKVLGESSVSMISR